MRRFGLPMNYLTLLPGLFHVFHMLIVWLGFVLLLWRVNSWVCYNMQYELTETATTETRYRTETRTTYYQYRDPNTGDIYLIPYTYDVQVPYSYTICTVTLTYSAMEDLVDDLLTDEQQELYETYMETKGNYPDLFP